jgi:hypothetical protein
MADITEAPLGTSLSSAARFWLNVDKRVGATVIANARRMFGIPRPRILTLNVPVATALGTPVPGWIGSVVVNSAVRVTGWQLHSLVSGSVSVDIRFSQIQRSQSTAITPVSIIGNSLLNPILSNGYSAESQDTTGWSNPVVSAGVLSFYVISASSIQQTTLGLTMLDMTQKVLEI